MEKRVLGKTGMEVTVLGFGGAEIAYQNVPFEQAEQLMNTALDDGLNVVDTAECYPGGEDLIGRALGYRRKDFFLFTKCGHASGLPLPDWDPRMLAEQIDRSLARLRTDYVDVIQLHSCLAEVLKQGDAIEVLQRAREAGKARFIGYSGDGEDALYAIQTGVFDTLQTSVNIADQQAIEMTLPRAVERSMGIIAKRPIANAAWKTGEKPKDAYHHEYWARLQDLQYEFLTGDLSHSVSVALRFTLTMPGVTTAIVGTTNPDRWAANARLIQAGALDSSLMEKIRRRWRDVARPEWVGQT